MPGQLVGPAHIYDKGGMIPQKGHAYTPRALVPDRARIYRDK